MHDKSQQADGAVGPVVDKVQIRPVDIDRGSAEPGGDALQHRAGGGVADGDDDAALGGIGLRLETDRGPVRARHLLKQLQVSVDAQRRNGQHIFRAEPMEVLGQFVRRPLRLVLRGVFDGLLKLVQLCRVVGIESLSFTELEGVQDELSVGGGMDLGRP